MVFSQKSYICNSVDLVEKLKNVNISENTIISIYNIISVYTNIDVAVAKQLLENKMNENYDSIEVSATALDCDAF